MTISGRAARAKIAFFARRDEKPQRGVSFLGKYKELGR
jgi:hypothetical protein